ncbi:PLASMODESMATA CALLOSE-BINDING PROTEIN 1 [Elaeis guineensis]|uniref:PLASMODESMATA CALLOSE-BINDING PROTEIN 3 n=1 Tax=Elaeis guineensis var. tenera TaxID=51953 RepID=A0A6I9QLE0_ELAGV|nr:PLASMODESMATA CALLOSE-BINDING PROTEIN 3 [Elaeis guineensis]
MAALLLLVLLLAISGGSDAAWCVCKSDQSDPALQKTIDYACGAGADCTAILQNGACYNPNTVLAHCSYAANSYYQRKGQADGSCDFSGTATLTNSDPGGNGCTYPATTSAAGTSSTPTGTNTAGSSTTTGTTSSTGTGGGVLGLGPTGTSSMDGNDGGLLPKAKMASLLSAILLSVLAFLRI